MAWKWLQKCVRGSAAPLPRTTSAAYAMRWVQEMEGRTGAPAARTSTYNRIAPSLGDAYLGAPGCRSRH